MAFLASVDFWVLVSFLLFLGLLLYFGVHKKAAAALDARAEAIAKELAEAKSLRDEAAKVLEDYRNKQRNAAKEAEAIVELANKEAEAMAVETSRDMKERFERRMKLAEDKIGRAEADAIQDVRSAAADAAVSAAQAVISDKLTSDGADKLVAQGIDSLKSKLN